MAIEEVICECFIPFSSMYTLISSLANGGPFLLFATLGIPQSEFGITMRLPRRMTSASWLTVNSSLIFAK